MFYECMLTDYLTKTSRDAFIMTALTGEVGGRVEGWRERVRRLNNHLHMGCVCYTQTLSYVGRDTATELQVTRTKRD